MRWRLSARAPGAAKDRLPASILTAGASESIWALAPERVCALGARPSVAQTLAAVAAEARVNGELQCVPTGLAAPVRSHDTRGRLVGAVHVPCERVAGDAGAVRAPLAQREADPGPLGISGTQWKLERLAFTDVVAPLHVEHRALVICKDGGQIINQSINQSFIDTHNAQESGTR